MADESNKIVSVYVLDKPWNDKKCTAKIISDRVIQIKYLLWFYRVIWMKNWNMSTAALSFCIRELVLITPDQIHVWEVVHLTLKPAS